MPNKDLIISKSYYPSCSVDFDLFYGNCSHTDPPAPNFVFGPVLSNLYLFQYNVTGSGDMVIDGKEFHTQTGDFLICFPGQTRIEHASKNDPWSSTWLELSGKAVESIIKMLGITPENPIIHNCDQSRIPILMQEILIMANNIGDPKKAFLIGSKILELFNEFLLIRSKESQNISKSYQLNYAQQAAYYLDMHFHSKDLTVDSLSRAIGLNRSYLYKIFKEEFKMSPQKYLMQLRIKKACEFLLLPHATITSVAYSVGYDPPIFSQAFKRILGISPSEYREKNLNK